MIITQKKKMLLLRFSNYKHFDFVSEHKKVLSENGYVWMLKIGKRIPDKRLTEVFNEPSALILKAPKDAGGKYYVAVVERTVNSSPTDGMVYPAYYNELIDDENMWIADSLDGTWFCIVSMEQLPDEMVSHLRLSSNDKAVEDVLSKTRSATVYVYSEDDIELNL